MKIEKRNRTKVKILESSKILFYLHGYTNTRFEMISEKIGKPKSLINYHFPKKQDILVVIMKDFLDKVYNEILSTLKCEYLIKYFVFTKVYFNALNFDCNTIRFHKDVLSRKDRTLEVYKNFGVIYNDINKNMSLSISSENLTLKEIAIFGSNQELLVNFYKGILDIDYEEVIELMSINTCKLMGVPNILINEYLNKSKSVYQTFEASHLNLFNQGEAF